MSDLAPYRCSSCRSHIRRTAFLAALAIAGGHGIAADIYVLELVSLLCVGHA